MSATAGVKLYAWAKIVCSRSGPDRNHFHRPADQFADPIQIVAGRLPADRPSLRTLVMSCCQPGSVS